MALTNKSQGFAPASRDRSQGRFCVVVLESIDGMSILAAKPLGEQTDLAESESKRAGCGGCAGEDIRDT
jgi:hypothetical protein